MKLTTEMKDKVCVITVEGSVDSVTSIEFDKAVTAVMSDCDKLILDLGGAEYVSSAGIRVLVKARQQMGGKRLVLRHVTNEVEDVLHMTGFLRMFTIEK
jgi:anti-sigma B factor antagonist